MHTHTKDVSSAEEALEQTFFIIFNGCKKKRNLPFFLDKRKFCDSTKYQTTSKYSFVFNVECTRNASEIL